MNRIRPITQSSVLGAMVLIPLLILSLGCASTIANYDQVAYENATSLKVETLALMDRAGDPYDHHATDIADLSMRLQKAKEYAQGFQHNEDVITQWTTLVGDSGILGRFFNEWHSQPISPPAYLQDKKERVASAFDKIIALEGRKNKATNR